MKLDKKNDTALEGGQALSGVKYSGTGWRNATDAEFEREKEILIARGIMHWTHPEDYGMPRYTLDECAFLISLAEGRGKNSILSKMQLCKDEARALLKVRQALSDRFGIRELSDVMDTAGSRELAKPVKETH